LKAAGYLLVAVTNQPDIGNGLVSADTVNEMHRRMSQALPIDRIEMCPHSQSEACDCRKPKPGLLRRAAEELGLDLSRSVMVGDKPSDVEAGQAAGAAGVLVLTGYGRGEWEYLRHGWTMKPDHIAEDLLYAVEWALARLESGKGAPCSR